MKDMKTICKCGDILLLIVCFHWIVSCDKNDDIELIDSSYKTLKISCGDDFEIPVLTNIWSIEFVQDVPSGGKMLDKDGNLLTLNGNEIVEASNGWLVLVRDKENEFTIRLKENFDKSNERKFIVCINAAGHRDYVTVIQQAGEYELIKTVFKEIEEQREIYTSNEGCTNLTLMNGTSEEVWEPYEYIFENVVESSDFESDYYGAFNWMPEERVEIGVPELIIDNVIRWNKICTYKKGIITTPYIKDIQNGNKILLQPHSIVHLSGEITYCKRVCNYTLTVKNVKTGTRFEINGIWTQIVPISQMAIASDKR